MVIVSSDSNLYSRTVVTVISYNGDVYERYDHESTTTLSQLFEISSIVWYKRDYDDTLLLVDGLTLGYSGDSDKLEREYQSLLREIKINTILSND